MKSTKAKKDVSASYNELKSFEGKQYTGMAVGRTHKWYYDQGEWKEKKITPDLWQFHYAVTKRRAGRAPEGSGVPLGTEYHWYIAAHQNVKKLNANDYSTSMDGFKFKVAHKRADSAKWSASDNAQRKRLVKFLQELIGSLENEETPPAPPAEDVPAKSNGRAVSRRAPVRKLPSRRKKRKTTI